MEIEFHSLFSQDRFECLDFTSLSDLDDNRERAIREVLDDAFLELFDIIEFYQSQATVDQKLRDELQGWLQSRDVPVIGGQRDTARLAEEVSRMTELAYPYASKSIKLQIARSLGLVIGADDHLNDQETGVNSYLWFHSDICQGRSPKTQWLEMYSDEMKEQIAFFDIINPALGGLVAKSFIEFLEATSLEQEFEQAPPIQYGYNKSIQSASATGFSCPQGYPSILRNQSSFALYFGLAIFTPSLADEVPLRYWILALEDLLTFIGRMNDLLSWQKEISRQSREETNYLGLETMTKARSGGKSNFSKTDKPWSFRDTLCNEFETTARAGLSLNRAFLGLTEEVSDGTTDCFDEPVYEEMTKTMERRARLWTAFKNGYITYSVNSERYGLHSLRERICE